MVEITLLRAILIFTLVVGLVAIASGAIVLLRAGRRPPADAHQEEDFHGDD